MDWPELLDHPFWTQSVKEDKNLEEGDDEKNDEEGGTEGKNDREGAVSAGSRCVDITFLYTFLKCFVLHQYYAIQQDNK